MGFLEFIMSNLSHTAPLLIAGAIAIAILVERSKALFKTYPIQNADGFYDKITELVMSGRIGDAIAVCDRMPEKPAAAVVKQGLLRAHQPENLIEHGIELAVGEASLKIQMRTSFLATIANVSTLLGLFGTIAGLIHSFEAVAHADPQQKSALLAAGISTAMNATMMGLAIAIPCMVAFSFLINRTNRLIAEIDHSAVRTLDVLKQRYYAADTESLNARNTHSAADDAGDTEEAATVLPMKRKSA
jgi:biopolymer transport protein ExbB